MSTNGYIHTCAGADEGQKRMSDLREMKEQVVVSYPISVLGTQLRSPTRAARASNDQLISPAPHLVWGDIVGWLVGWLAGWFLRQGLSM